MQDASRLIVCVPGHVMEGAILSMLTVTAVEFRLLQLLPAFTTALNCVVCIKAPDV